jgi:hypothetical protein
MLDTIQKTLETVLEDDPASSTYRVGRDIFTDENRHPIDVEALLAGVAL